MTTDDQLQECRPIETLLKLDSFQGMTDAEIQLVMQWREQQAAFQAQVAARRAYERDIANKTLQAYTTAIDSINTVLADLSKPLILQEVDNEQE